MEEEKNYEKYKEFKIKKKIRTQNTITPEKFLFRQKNLHTNLIQQDNWNNIFVTQKIEPPKWTEY